jgi:site-specific DNA-methyltransferase (adenine-specific)
MSHESFLGGKVGLCCGDSLHFLRDQPDNRYDSFVSDPPYALVSITKRFANSPRSERTENTENPYGRTGRGFMGQRWDNGDTAHSIEFWEECLRVLKPGAHVVAFAGTRTYHRLACAIEDAGFEIRDQIGWCFGSGFPKSHNAGNGWGTALKPAWEPICLARKPLVGTVAENVLQHGTGAINIDGCRIHADDAKGYEYTVARTMPGAGQNKTGERKQQGVSFTGKTQDGRWPANLIHDGSDEVVEAFPDAPGQQQDVALDAPSARTGNVYGKMNRHGEKSADRRYHDRGSTDFAALPGMRRDDSGSAARFFYAAKADTDDRLGSKHPTVKPIDLMQWLVRLITPKGGLVLDPFAGTGTTAEACFREGMRCMLVERETEYHDDIRRRMALVMAGPDERARESIKAKAKNQPIDAGPLFATNP